jgi:hypothetical protein
MNALRRPSRVGAYVALALLAFGSIAACSSGAASTAAPAVAGPVSDGGKPADGGASNDETGGTSQQPSGSFAADQAMIVYSGTLDLEINDLRAAVDQANQLVAGLGGHVASSDTTTKDDVDYATVTYRIPAENWDEALAGLRAVGAKVLNETTKSEDVTGQVVDLDARIANARASETALQGIMDRATSIQDVLDVQRELTAVRGDIESMTAQRDQLANRATLATLAVTFETAVTQTQAVSGSWDLSQQIDDALSTLVRVGQGLVTVGIWLLIVVLPIAVPVLIVLALAVWLRRRWLRTHPRAEISGPPVGSSPM